MELITAEIEQACLDYARVEAAIHFIEQNSALQPDLAQVAAAVGLSEYHFQRLFTRWAGVSPKRFLQYLTKEHAKKLLAESHSLLDVAYQVGLSGPGRLHDLFVFCEAVTPGEYKLRGAGLVIRYGYHPTIFGECLLACSDKGITNLYFPQPSERLAFKKRLAETWPRADLVQDQDATLSFAQQVSLAAEEKPTGEVRLHLSGTNFQIKVWEALLELPAGTLVAYKDLAMFIGMPEAARAVGAAVGANPLPVIIPCHRVIQKDGNWGGYRWGMPRKKALLGWEFAQAANERLVAAG